MKVHIVALPDNWVIERYAKVLVRELGWTAGAVNDPQADVNYYMPYLLLNRPHTKTAAWFTHLEEVERNPGHPRSKMSRWHTAAERVDLRMCQALKYKRILEKHGPTAQAPTPVNLRHFRLPKLRIGVAGRVYKVGRRKGEILVRQLMETNEFSVVGAGSGWPCPTKMYDWKDVPRWYQKLDVFLITSLVEGGPQTALEALASGVMVVGPEGVGFLDELPIVRYKKGNFEDMLAKLREIDNLRKARREAVKGFSERQWAQIHRVTFGMHLG